MRDDIHTPSITYVSTGMETEEQTACWFGVSGDLDDFIYYGEEPRNSER